MNLNLNLSKNKLIKIALTVAIGFAVCYLLQKYYSKVSLPTTEEFDNHNVSENVDVVIDPSRNTDSVSSPPTTYNDYSGLDGSDEDITKAQKESNGNQYPKDCFPKDQLSPSELLPGNSNTRFAALNPDAEGELSDQNFLEAGYHTGVNTVGQTLRNANYQVRSEPPNPQVKVSPWLQTTIEPDTNRKPLEIGGGCN